MRHVTLAGLVVALCAYFGATSGDTARLSDSSSLLWAGISVDRPIVELGNQQRVTVAFALFNDGDSVVNPNIGGATLLVNDQPWPDSEMMFGNGPRDSHFDLLPPGDYVYFTVSAGEFCKEPGIYRLRWRGDGYESTTVTLRVVPQHLVPY